MQPLIERIQALPEAQQRIAEHQFQLLVEARRAQLGPPPMDRLALAQKAGLRPDPWQTQVLQSSATRLLLNCARQTGKSTITALLSIHTAHYSPGALILLLSPTLRQSQELFKKALDIHHSLDHPVATEAQSALRLELANGSRIVSLPGKEETVRGYSGVEILVVDEAARVSDDLYLSVRPMLAVSGGRLLALSTPFGTRGWWYEAWRSKEPWERYEVPASTCPRISSDFLGEEREAMGQWWYAQEYECQFLDAETQPFRREDIDQTFFEDVQPWQL